ncbi:MAG: SEL1-like repeat protein [Pseudomonadota bacterium]
MTFTAFSRSRIAGLCVAIAAMTVFASAPFAVAQDVSAGDRPSFPVEPDTEYVARMKKDADQAFERKRYDRAFRMFRYGLAWRGDKYAQYMVGYMKFNGYGQPADPVRGAAWLKLARERGDDRKLNTVFKDAYERLDAQQKARADREFENLKKEYGDRRVLRRLIMADRRTLLRATGTRTGATDMLPVSVQLPNGQSVPGSVYYGRIKDRMQRRLDYLSGRVSLGSFEVLDEVPEEEARPAPADDETLDDAALEDAARETVKDAPGTP